MKEGREEGGREGGEARRRRGEKGTCRGRKEERQRGTENVVEVKVARSLEMKCELVSRATTKYCGVHSYSE